MDKEKGSLTIITGCMFSGKTSELIKRVRRARHANEQVIIFKPQIDDRYEEFGMKIDVGNIISHDGPTERANLVSTVYDIMGKLYTSPDAEDIDLIAIDEAQFIECSKGDFLRFIKHVTDIFGIDVCLSMLNLNYLGHAWPNATELFPYADHIDYQYAVCKKCWSKEATRTYKKKDTPPTDDNNILVAGDEVYEARCIQCLED